MGLGNKEEGNGVVLLVECRVGGGCSGSQDALRVVPSSRVSGFSLLPAGFREGLCKAG